MNILLLIPPASLDSSYGQLKDFSNPQPSIGLAYIAAVLRDSGFPVSVLDAYVEQLGIDEIVSSIRSRKADLVGISVLTTAADVTAEIVKRLRTELPGVKVVLGNMHASLFSEKLLKNNLADFIVHREGEHTFLNLARALEKGSDVGAIRGISFVEGDQVVHTTPRPPIEDLDSLPYPAWDLFPMASYKTDPRTEIILGQVEMQILATRGCPNQCTFCSSRTERSLGSRYRMRNPKNIVDEIEYMCDHFGARVFSFMDLAFPLVKKHAMALFREIIGRGLNRKIAWATECRVKPLDLETLKMMRESGCARINFGIESGCNDILKLLRKNFTTADVENAVRMARDAGIEVDGMLMIGLPTETERHIRQTIRFATKLGLRYAIFNIFVPYPGCALFDTLTAEGKIRFDKWSDFTSYPTYTGGKPVYIPDELTHERLMGLQKHAMRRFYLRPRFILQEIRRFKPAKIRQYWNGLKGILLGGK